MEAELFCQEAETYRFWLLLTLTAVGETTDFNKQSGDLDDQLNI
jgi:hypothetical protein